MRFAVDVNSERRILLLEPIECTREIRRLLSFRSNSERNNGLRNEHRRLYPPISFERLHNATRLTIEYPPPPGASVNVSPLEHSTPNIAQISPAPILSTSSISSECILTNLGTLTFFPVRTFVTVPPFLSIP